MPRATETGLREAVESLIDKWEAEAPGDGDCFYPYNRAVRKCTEDLRAALADQRARLKDGGGE